MSTADATTQGPCSWTNTFSSLVGEVVPTCKTCDDIYSRRPDGCPFKTKSGVPVNIHVNRLPKPAVRLPEPMSVLTDKEIMQAVEGWKQFDKPEGLNTTEALIYGAIRCALDLYVQKAQARMWEQQHASTVNETTSTRPGAR